MWDLRAFHSFPTGAPTTVPRTHLGLSLLFPLLPDSRRECAATTLGPADLQRARVGSGDHCSRALGVPRCLTATPTPARPYPRPPAPAAPTPALTTIFDWAGGGGGPTGRCSRRGRLFGPSSPSLGKGHHFLRPHASPRRGVGGCGLCAASPQGSPTARRVPLAGSALHTHPREHFPVLYLLPLRLRLLLVAPPLARTPCGPPGADIQKGANDGGV